MHAAPARARPVPGQACGEPRTSLPLPPGLNPELDPPTPHPRDGRPGLRPLRGLHRVGRSGDRSLSWAGQPPPRPTACSRSLSGAEGWDTGGVAQPSSHCTTQPTQAPQDRKSKPWPGSPQSSGEMISPRDPAAPLSLPLCSSGCWSPERKGRLQSHTAWVVNLDHRT
jgi:hypothetical protein